MGFWKMIDACRISNCYDEYDFAFYLSIYLPKLKKKNGNSSFHIKKKTHKLQSVWFLCSIWVWYKYYISCEIY